MLMTFSVPNQYRVREGFFGSDDTIGGAGLFTIPIMHAVGGRIALLDKEPYTSPTSKPNHSILVVIADDGCNGLPLKDCWEHVSVQRIYNGKHYIPTWYEMCFIKDLFWDADDYVLQYHPPKSEYVNNHEYILHLW